LGGLWAVTTQRRELFALSKLLPLSGAVRDKGLPLHRNALKFMDLISGACVKSGQKTYPICKDQSRL